MEIRFYHFGLYVNTVYCPPFRYLDVRGTSPFFLKKQFRMGRLLFFNYCNDAFRTFMKHGLLSAKLYIVCTPTGGISGVLSLDVIMRGVSLQTSSCHGHVP